MPKPLREYKDKVRFEAVARCVLQPSAQGKTLAFASLSDLKTILPADAEDYPDLLPIAGNACVINLANGNDDVMDTDVAVHIFKQFIHKPINIEHDRSEIVGHITNAALTKFNSNYKLGSGSDILSPEEVKGSLDPFNIAIGGYIYRALNTQLANKILDSNDPDSPEFLNIAFSWELAFDESQVLVGGKERSEASLVTDPQTAEAYRKHLKYKKGTGRLPDGRRVYRLVSFARLEDGQIDYDSVLAMGVALTLAPAGQVAGVVTPVLPESEESSASLAENVTKNENSDENISHSSSAIVTTNTTITMKVLKSLNDLKALNDESVKEFSFANIANIVEAGEQAYASTIKQQLEAELTAKAQAWAAEKQEKEQAAAAAQQKLDEAVANVAQLQADLKASNDKIATLEFAQQEAAASATFQQRMAFFDEKFELDDADRKAIASRIKGLDDAAFTAIANDEISVFLASKNKETIAAKAQAAVASQQQPTEEEKAQAAADALAKAESAQASLPNTPASNQTLKEKYASVFKMGEGIQFSK